MACDSDPLLFDMNNNQTQRFIQTLVDIKFAYGSVHRYISILLCVFGLLANSVHIWVLTRSQMRDSAVHAVLTCIAMADMGTMISYSIYITRFEFFMDESGYSYGWAVFLKLHAVFSIALHAISLYLVVLMAYIRFMAIKARYTKWLMPQLACVVSAVVAVCIFVLCIPTFLVHEIFPHRNNFGEVPDPSKFSISFSNVSMDNQCAFLKINLWLTGILLKAVPCVLLLIFTFCLLTKIKENSKKRSALLHTDDKRSDRITYVLLLMVAVFLSTELPQGVFAIFNAIFTYQFHGFIYMSIADILDLLSLINCYVGFLVYVITSSKYRETLWTLIPFLKNGYVKTQSHANNHKGMGRKQKAGDTISIDVRKDGDHV